MKIFNFILDLIAPKKCYSCEKEWLFLCPDCQKKEQDYKWICFVCKGTSRNFSLCSYCSKEVFYDKVLILNNYNSKVTNRLIKDAKFHNKKSILEDFSVYLYDKFIINHKIRKKEDYIIASVPSYWSKKLKRWYNQSEILAKEFSKTSWIKYEKKLLKKIKNTKQQSLLRKEERATNLIWAFSLNKVLKEKIKQKNIILIDDVITTGTTVNEISKILKENKALRIIVIVIASS